MSIVPQHTVALNFNGYHGVIYVDPGPNLNTVSWLHYAGSEPDRKQYEPQNAIQVKGKNAIKAHQGKIALVHYTTNNEETYQIRLYYVQNGTAEDDPGQDHQIRELCYTQKVSDLKAGKKS